MNKFIRYWNQNRKQIIKIIAIIAFIFIIIQVTNMLLKSSDSDGENKIIVDKTKPIQSVITGETVSEEKTDDNTKIIKDFINFCNNKEYKNAYDLLTDDCKEEFNNDINKFINDYYNNIFKVKRVPNIELWINSGNLYTYKIIYYEDNLLATGGSSMNNNVEDYITVVNKSGKSKINLGGFITKQNINKSKTVENINITINSRKIYKNYEKYNITITNNTDNKILIGNGTNNEDICLLDNNDVKYKSYINELPLESIIVEAGYQKNVNIKFNKIYDLYRIIEKIEFSNIILNGQEYFENKNAIRKTEISIEI